MTRFNLSFVIKVILFVNMIMVLCTYCSGRDPDEKSKTDSVNSRNCNVNATPYGVEEQANTACGQACLLYQRGIEPSANSMCTWLKNFYSAYGTDPNIMPAAYARQCGAPCGGGTNAGTFTVTFDSSGGTTVTSKTVISPATTIDILPTAPTKIGFAFSGWYTLPNGAGTAFASSSLVSSNITVYAYWVVAPPGSTWTARTMPVSHGWVSITYGNGLFVAVASDANIAVTSPDGITWTQRALPAAGSWRSVSFGNGVFVATRVGNTCATSSDGITWTERNMPNGVWQAVTYGNGVFVAVYNGAFPYSAVSPDGINWTTGTLPSSQIWKSVTYGNGVFVAVVYGGTIAATSANGLTWTVRTLPTSSNWTSVTYGNNVFVAIANGTSSAASSSDGITWTTRSMPAVRNWNSVTYGNGVFVAVASSVFAATSPDGIAWTGQTSLPNLNSWIVAYGNGAFVAVSDAPATSP